MRLLTPEQQAASPLGQEIGGLEKQRHDSFVAFGLDDHEQPIAALHYFDRTIVLNWRDAIAKGKVSRSRYGSWEPFRKIDGCEKWMVCNEGYAWAYDGVHVLIQTPLNEWISRSAQVVTFIILRPYGGAKKRSTQTASDYIKDKKPTKVADLISEYDSLFD